MTDARDLFVPLFEGMRPNGTTTKLTGKADSPVRALGLDEEVVLIVTGTTSAVNHKRVDGGGLQREQTVKASEVLMLDPADPLVAQLREHAYLAGKRMRDAADNVTPLPGLAGEPVE